MHAQKNPAFDAPGHGNLSHLNIRIIREPAQLPLDEFRAFAADLGFTLPAEIVADGRVHRFSTKGRAGDDAGAYVLHLDGVPNGWVQNWRDGSARHEWRSSRRFTPAEAADLKAEIRERQAQRKADEAVRRASVAAEAERIWSASTPAKGCHPYLTRKGIQPHELREHDGRLVLPVRQGGELVGLQFIDPDGGKRFLTGTPKQGGYYIVGDIEVSYRVAIAEGFATAASIYESTGIPCAVAFDAGNLPSVAKALSLRLSGVDFIVCADDDWRNPTNPGLTKAREAAALIGAKLAVPVWDGHRDEKATDFNDLLLSYGADAVRACIASAELVNSTDFQDDAEKSGSSIDAFQPVCAGHLLRRPAPERKWIVENLIPENVVTLLAGDGGTGKSTLALQLGIAAATGTPWVGNEVQRVRTLILSAEDDLDEMHFRCEKILEGLPGDSEANRKALGGNLWLLDATDALDPTLATYDEKAGIAPSETFKRIAAFIEAHGIGFFIADSAADVSRKK